MGSLLNIGLRGLQASTLLVTIATFVFSVTAHALSEEQKALYTRKIYYFDASAQQQCDGSTTLSGRNNAEKVFNFFTGKGLTAKQAAGILGNMEHESGIEPQRLQNTSAETKTPAESLSPAQLSDNRLGWGVVQFTPPGKFINNVSPKSKANDIGIQLEFIWNQLQGKGPVAENPKILEQIKSTTTVREAVLAFQGNTSAGGIYIGYERPGDQSGTVDLRTEAAEKYLIEFGSGTSEEGSESVVCDTSNSGEVVGEYSLPVPKKYFASNPGWFTAPHHDYPSSDIPIPSGTKIFSASTGTVTDMNNADADGRGVHVEIDAGDGVVYKYFHGTPGSVKVRKGSKVEAGQTLMLSDNTGHSSGPHLHFQIEVDGAKKCPQNFLEGIGKGSPVDVKSLPGSGCTYVG